MASSSHHHIAIITSHHLLFATTLFLLSHHDDIIIKPFLLTRDDALRPRRESRASEAIPSHPRRRPSSYHHVMITS
jgi:hypothetical protein